MSPITKFDEPQTCEPDPNMDMQLDIDSECSQHSIDSISSSSSSRKRIRALPEDAHAFAEPSKDVSSQRQKLSRRERLFDESNNYAAVKMFESWVASTFRDMPIGEAVRLRACEDGASFDCLRFVQPTGDSAILVRHGKIHRSILGWIESCSVASIDQSDEMLAPSCFMGHERIALKVFDLQTVYSMPSKENALTELALHGRLSSVGNENISPLLACFRTSTHLYAAFPMFEKGDLFEYLASLDAAQRRLSEPELRAIMTGALNAVKACHDQGICHRDVSLENICLGYNAAKRKLIPVLIDFGVATDMEKETHSVQHTGAVGKAKYMAPELYQSPTERPSYDGRKCDVFSLGVMLLILTIQMEPWDSTSASDPNFNRMILKGELELALRIWGIPVSKSQLSLLKSMLNPNPELRPTVEEVFAHEWFSLPTTGAADVRCPC